MASLATVTTARAFVAPHRARGTSKTHGWRRHRRRVGHEIAFATSNADDGDAHESPPAALAFDDGTPLIKIKRKVKPANAPARASIEPPKVMASRARILREAADASLGSDESDEYGVNAMDVVERDVAVPDFRDSAGVLRWMVKTTDEMLDDMEAREPPTAVAAWEISKRAEAVASNTAVRGTADVVGKVSVAAVRAAAPVVAQGATKAIQEGGKFAVKAVVRAAAAKAGFETTKKDKERERAREDAVAAAAAKSVSSSSSSSSPAGNAAARVLGALSGKTKTPAPKTEAEKQNDSSKKKRFFSL